MTDILCVLLAASSVSTDIFCAFVADINSFADNLCTTVLLSMYSYCCPCILIVRPCILIVVYIFLLLFMSSYCCLCVLLNMRPFQGIHRRTGLESDRG